MVHIYPIMLIIDPRQHYLPRYKPVLYGIVNVGCLCVTAILMTSKTAAKKQSYQSRSTTTEIMGCHWFHLFSSSITLSHCLDQDRSSFNARELPEELENVFANRVVQRKNVQILDWSWLEVALDVTGYYLMITRGNIVLGHHQPGSADVTSTPCASSNTSSILAAQVSRDSSCQNSRRTIPRPHDEYLWFICQGKDIWVAFLISPRMNGFFNVEVLLVNFTHWRRIEAFKTKNPLCLDSRQPRSHTEL